MALVNYLEAHPIGIVAPGAGAVFSDYDSVIPDLVFVQNDRWEKIVANDRFVAAPNLVIEVVSPGKENRKRDFKAKRELYGQLRCQRILDCRSRRTINQYLSFTRQTLEEIVSATRSDELTSPLLPGFASV